MWLGFFGGVVVGCGILPLAKLNVHSGFRLKGKAARLQLQRRTERLQTSSASLRSKIRQHPPAPSPRALAGPGRRGGPREEGGGMIELKGGGVRGGSWGSEKVALLLAKSWPDRTTLD